MQDYAAQRETMVDGQVRPADVTKYPVIAAMRAVPREVYVPSEARALAYMGDDLPLGAGRVLLAPRTFAKMLDALDIGPRDLVLDIGAAHGYGMAVIARLAEAVVGVEEDAAMAAEAERALTEQQVDNAVVAPGLLADGAPRNGPYDVIVIEGAVERLPDALVDQLKSGGRIAAPWHQAGLGVVRIGVKAAGRINWRFGFNASAPVLPGFAAERQFEF
jgi:protein-L-isoaspartate(D-aspartate) O-methyltransferase